jgi:hypothetical protein
MRRRALPRRARRIGRRLYALRTRRATLVFRVRGRRIVEVGIASRRFVKD